VRDAILVETTQKLDGIVVHSYGGLVGTSAINPMKTFYHDLSEEEAKYWKAQQAKSTLMTATRKGYYKIFFLSTLAYYKT
jgi:hypothetical protein